MEAAKARNERAARKIKRSVSSNTPRAGGIVHGDDYYSSGFHESESRSLARLSGPDMQDQNGVPPRQKPVANVAHPVVGEL